MMRSQREGRPPAGNGSLGQGSFGQGSLGQGSLGQGSLGQGSLGSGSRRRRGPHRAVTRRAVTRISLLALAVFGALLPVQAPVAAESASAQYIVRLDPESVPEGAGGAAADSLEAAVDDVTVTDVFEEVFEGFAATMSAKVADALAADPKVASVEEVGTVEMFQSMAVSGTQPGAVWGLDRIDQRSLPLSGGYSYPNGGEGVTAYVVDSGIRPDHVEFSGRVTPGRNFVGGIDPTDSSDCNGHGTHVAGTIGGTTYGVAKKVTLVPVRVFGCSGSTSTLTIVNALEWVMADHDDGEPAVVNMSLGGGASSSLDAATAALVADGIVVSVAAGNSTADACQTSPARTPAAVTVGASDRNDAIAGFSNYGTCVDLFAPGVAVVSSVPSSTTATASYNGTSMAAPHVAGAAAVLLAAYPNWKPAVVNEFLVNNASPNRITGLSGAKATSPNLLLYSTVVAAPSPLNDNFADARTLALTTGGSVSGSTVGATAQVGEPAHDGDPAANSVWWKFEPSRDGELSIDLTGSASAVRVAIYEGSTLASLEPVASARSSLGSAATLVAELSAGVTYRLAIDGIGGATGSVTLGADWAPTVDRPTNDAFDAATPFTVPLAAALIGDSIDATAESGEPAHGGVGAYSSVWWRFTAPTDGTITLRTEGSDFDTTLSLYRGTSVAALTSLAGNDDVTSGTLWSRITADVEEGVTYHVAVDGWQGATGNVRLAAEWSPAVSTFESVAPRRVFDTRPGFVGERSVAKSKVAGGYVLRVNVTGISGVTPASGVGAVSLNVTVTEPDAGGFVTVWPCGVRPNASSVNFVAGQTIANSLIAPVSASGEVCFFSSQPTHLLADVTGWFSSGSDYSSVAPRRVFDTRPGFVGERSVAKSKVAGGYVLRVNVTGISGVTPASGVGAVSLNVTVTEPDAGGFVTVWPCGVRPNASSVNFVAGQTIANSLIAPVSASGEVCFFSSQPTHLLADVDGWFPA